MVELIYLRNTYEDLLIPSQKLGHQVISKGHGEHSIVGGSSFPPLDYCSTAEKLNLKHFFKLL